MPQIPSGFGQNRGILFFAEDTYFCSQAEPRSAIQISPRLALVTALLLLAPYLPNSVSEAPIAAAYSSIQFTSAHSSFDGSLSIAASISVTVLTSAIYPASQISASFEPQYVTDARSCTGNVSQSP